jgi:hypothetical protein
MTKGSIYIMENPSFKENMLKIGRTEGEPQRRAKKLFTTGVPDKFTISYEEDVSDCILAEKLIHKKLKKFRYKKNREFFVLPLQEAISQVQEVTQRGMYQPQNLTDSIWHTLNENMTVRWLCYSHDFVALIRYPHPLLDEIEMVDIWQCEEGDQFMITDRPCDDPSDIALDKAINGHLIDFWDIYPSDRIIWVGKPRINSQDSSEYSILSILDCQSYAKMARFPKDFYCIEGYPVPAGDLLWFGANSKPQQALREAVLKIKERGSPHTWGRPDMTFF